MGAVNRLAQVMYAVSGALLVLMMLTVLLDVTSRAVFGATDGSVDFTFRGAVEIVSYSLLFMVLFAFPYAVSRGQVIVDLFTENMSERWKSILDGIYMFGFGLLGLGMTVRFYESAWRVAESGETTQDLLIPLTYIYAVTTFATAMLTLRGFLVGLQQLIESRRQS